MSMRNERPDPIDALIDGAARQMITGEPSASLRSAVRDRIEGRRPVWSLVPALGVAVGVVIAALIVGRTLSGPDGTPNTARPTIEVAATPGAPESRPTIDVQTPSAVEQGSQAVRLTRRLADDVAAPPQEEEPLIPPITVEPLEPVQIAVGNLITVESSGVIPIQVEPLQLEPLRGIE
jgi:hypothetical protein